MLHMKVCLSSPRTEQFLPPNCGSGLLHDRVLKRTPVPQDLVHLENTVQCEYPPSSAKSLKEKLFFTISKASIIVIHPLLTQQHWCLNCFTIITCIMLYSKNAFLIECCKNKTKFITMTNRGKENALKNQWELQVKPSKLLTNTKDVTYFNTKFF